MPSKRKRAGPGYNRDDPSAPRRTKPAYNQVYRVPLRNISGPGIFVTCVQGKERKAALQFIDILNEVADRIYPGVAPQPLPEALPEAAPEKSKPADEDDQDAMRNGAAPTTSAEKPVVPPAAPATENKTQPSDDIAAQIAAELKDIKASERSSTSSRRNRKDAGAVRFRNIETDTECFLFISVSPPLDPYKLVYTLLADVEASGEPRSRFVQRLTPVSTTTAANADSLTSLARSVLPQFFPASGKGSSFKIDPRIRSHSKLKRNDVIHIIASSIPTAPALALETDEQSEAAGERRKIHSANLTNPDYWIVVEVVKNCAAISMVSDYERWKKLNVQSVAQAANEKRANNNDDDDEGRQQEGRIGASLVAKPSAAAAAVQESKRQQPEVNKEVASTVETAPLKASQEETSTKQESTQTDADDADENDRIANFRLF